MLTVINAVGDFLPHLRSRVVRLMCNNAVTVAYIKNEGGTRSHTLMQLTIRLLKWCDRKVITLVPVHLPGVHNIQADSLSRVGQTLTTEWTMAMERLRPVFAKWGEPRIDLFATFANRRLIKFISPYPDPRAEWTDAMSMPWDNGRGLLYALPPFKMVPQVLQKVAQSPGVKVILIAQLQPAASWFPELMDLSQEDPIPLYVGRSRRLDRRRGDRDSSLPAVKSTRVETLRAILRAKGHSREAANMMSRCLRESSLQLYESHWLRFVAFCRTKRWHVFRVRSHHFSTYMMQLFRDYNITSHVCGFRCTAESCLSGTFIWCCCHYWDHLSHPTMMRRGILGWRHSPKMADIEMCVPVTIGFGKTALATARIEYRAWQMCVLQRKHTTTTCGISVAGTWIPSKESATDTGPWMDHGAWDCPLESDGTGENAMSR